MAGGLALARLGGAVSTNGESIRVDPSLAVPSFCSGATYLVFLKSVQSLIDKGMLSLGQKELKALVVAGQSDGAGIWGRWNANGPGTARLFYELDLGANFQDFARARPGDFMKIFWTKEIGRFERGHSVVFLGTEKRDGIECARFWSSNLPEGYGEKIVPRSKIACAVFSRFERPQNLARLKNLPDLDSYLAQMLSRRSTAAELRQKCGVLK